MNLKHLSIENFGSYQELELDLTGQGLTLIHGATGSGKSTVLDAILWTLYGETGKDTNADDVRNWTNEHRATVGRLELEGPDGVCLWVTRIRGGKTGNDLFFHGVDGSPIRGKDLNDTQRILAARLGVDCDGFVGACYYHEFSSSGSFFTAKAKDRRAVFEQLADLTVATRLGTCAADAKRLRTKELGTVEGRNRELLGKKSQCESSLSQLRRRSKQWGDDQNGAVAALRTKAQNFEQEKEGKVKAAEAQAEAWSKSHRKDVSNLVGAIAKLKSAIETTPDYELLIAGLKDGTKCKHCGALDERTRKQVSEYQALQNVKEKQEINLTQSEVQLQALRERDNPHHSALASAHVLENHYYAQLATQERLGNPFEATIADTEEQLSASLTELTSVSATVTDLKHQISALETLYELASKLRGELLSNIVKQIEQSTNAYLEEYFDGELRVIFEASEDNIEVSVSKSGYACGFKQLSKGQRQILRLCFWLAAREARCNHYGQSFNVLLLDEPTDGLHPEMKVKAVRLFEKLALEHETVFVVEHGTEAKACFGNSYRAVIENDISRLERE